MWDSPSKLATPEEGSDLRCRKKHAAQRFAVAN
jgi:hypothetical protein